MTSLKLPVVTEGPVKVKATVRIGPPADLDPVLIPVPELAVHKQPVRDDACSHKLLRTIFERFLSAFRNKKGVRAD